MKKPGITLSTLTSLNKASEPEPVRAKPFRRPGKDRVSCTYTLDPDDYQRLQEIKLTRGTSLQGLLDEAVDTWLISLGEKPLKGRGK